MQNLIDCTASITHRVAPSDLASSWGNTLPVLSTPILLWLAELACMKVIDSALPEEAMTVGYAHDSRHIAPTLVGNDVIIFARLESIDGRLLRFFVEASSKNEIIFTGHHTRAVVERKRFEAKLEGMKS